MRLARWLGWLILLSAVGCASEQTAPPGPALSRSQKPEPSPAPIRRTTFEAAVNPFPGIPDGRVAVQIRAHVNGTPIFDQEVRDACYPNLLETLSLPEPERSQRQAEIFRRQLDDIIDREVLLQDAFARLQKNGAQYLDKLKAAASKEFDKVVHQMKQRANMKTDEELKEFVRSHGQSLEGIRRQVERGFMAREYIRSRVYPSVERIGHQQILEYYRNHAADFQAVDRVKWQHLFIDASKYKSREEARRFAEELAGRMRSGEPIESLVKYDNGDSSYRSGEGIGQVRGEIRPPEAEPILFAVQDGEVGRVLESATGFHVLRVVKREYAGQTPLDEKTQGEIRKKLQNEVAMREMKRLIDELKQKCTIEIASTGP
jgi:parvulin-like peptidyl-prolyl isomerase